MRGAGGYALEAVKFAKPFSLRGIAFRFVDFMIGVNPQMLEMFRSYGVSERKMRLILPFALKRPDARIEHEPVVRLGQKIVASRLDRANAIGGIAKRGNKDDRNARGARIALEAAAHFETSLTVAHPELTGGHRDIEDREIRPMRNRHRERRRRITRDHAAKTERLQLIDEQFDIRIHVIGD